MTTTTATLPTINPLLGRFQLRLNGHPTGDVLHFRDIAQDHLKACRQIITSGAWELVDLRTGEVIPADAMEAAALAARDEFEQREAAEGWAETPVLPAPCPLCRFLIIPIEAHQHSDIDGGLVHTSCFDQAEAEAAVA